MMNRWCWQVLAGVVFVAAAGAWVHAERGDEGKPNFIIVFVDDLGYQDVGCFGSDHIKTPHIDRLAAEGTKFTSFYAQNVCGPSRAALLTGSYPVRTAEPKNQKNPHTIMHPREITLAEQLQSAGYATGCIGKWHLAGHGESKHGRGTGPYPEKLMPNAQGFDYFFGTPKHNGFTRQPSDRWHTEVYRNTELITRDADVDKLTGDQTREAIAFIERNKDKPFFCYLAYSMVHVVLGADQTFRGQSDRGLYGDAIMEIDDGVGRIVDTLKKHGIDDDTVIVFTSDNGPWIEASLGDHGGSAHPLRGMKMNTWEGGLRVPGIVRWPGRVPAGRVTDQMCTTLDLFATFSSLAGAPLPDDRTLDSLDMSEFWLGRSDASPRQTFFYYSFTHLQAVRRGPWKLVRPRPVQPKWTSWYGRMIDAVDAYKLYNLENDIAELNDVAEQHPGVVDELKQVLDAGRAELGDYDLVGAGARFFDANPPAAGDRRRHPSGSSGRQRVATKLSTGAKTIEFEYAPAIEHEAGVTRRDPSDVIRVGETYYVWYTKVADGEGVWQYPSGYSGEVYYATSKDGRSFAEQGLALGHGAAGAWDEHGVFTPNILKWKGKYYLYYTGVPRPFDENTATAIGVAVADSPEGPWNRHAASPVLKADADNPPAFDSMRVDDASLIVRGGKVWLYYKGRCIQHGDSGPGMTRMGMAMAASPVGPFERSERNPLHRGHEVMIWPQGFGVGSMATNAGPLQMYYAFDGVQFAARNLVAHPPGAPGLFRADDFDGGAIHEIPRWGISMRQHEGDVFLVRFDFQY